MNVGRFRTIIKLKNKIRTSSCMTVFWYFIPIHAQNKKINEEKGFLSLFYFYFFGFLMVSWGNCCPNLDLYDNLNQKSNPPWQGRNKKK